jgi:hypothetical protein
VTIANNTAINGGGMWLGYSNPEMINSIIWDNFQQSIYFAYASTADITYTNIQGEWEGEGNISSNPLFINPENGDFTLAEESPCIDAGTADLDGDGYDDTSDYFGEAPDMGAYEFEGSSIAGDLNGDGLFNVLDIVMLVDIVLGNADPVSSGDLNGDGLLNVLDIVMLVDIILNP